MTIMILNIEIPEFGHITDTKELAAFLLKQLNSMRVFFIALVVIAVYWDVAFILVPLAFMARKKLVTIKYFRPKKSNLENE